MIDLTTVKNADPEVFEAMNAELARQRGNIELIASENFVSPAVMAAVGSHLTNKYAEGLPGKRYYGGCQYVDIVENLAIERCKQLFGCDHANVQPHSGAEAYAAVYFALLTPGDTILGMNLSRRAPHARLSRQYLGQVFQHRSLRRVRDGRAHRL